MTALIDADGIPYIICYKFRYFLDNTNLVYINSVENTVDEFIKNMLDNIKATEYIGVLSNDEKTFRHSIAKHRVYKGKRKYDQDDNGYSVWNKIVKERMRTQWNFMRVPDGSKLETDDVISILAYRLKDSKDVVICSADKDMLQIPVKHFNFVKWDRGIIQAEELGELIETKEGKEKKYFGHGFKFLMFQMIIGDQVDNIMGIKGKGPDFAYKALKDCSSKLGCVKAVLKAYIDWVDSYYGKLLFKEMYSLLKLKEESDTIPDITPIVR